MQDVLPLKIIVILVTALILPKFTYCDTDVNDMFVGLDNKLQWEQNYHFIYSI